MPYLPTIRDYKPFYIQRDGEAHDVAETWGLIVQHNPYPIFPAPKARYSVDWKDEDGTDEYGTTQFLDSLDFEVEFWLAEIAEPGASSRQVLRERFNNILDWLRDGPFKLYDSYTGIGLSQVLFESFSEDKYISRLGRTDYFFKVKFRCYDPLSRLVYDAEQNTIQYSPSPASLPEAYTPTVVGYQPFYLATTTDDTAVDSRSYGLIAKTDPHPVFPEAKSPYVEKIFDENTAAAPNFGVYFKAINFDVDFFIKAYDTTVDSVDYSAAEMVYFRLEAFRTFLTTHRLLVFDSYTTVGYADVQYESGEVKQFVARGDWAMAILSVRFRANNPITTVSLQSGNLIPN